MVFCCLVFVGKVNRVSSSDIIYLCIIDFFCEKIFLKRECDYLISVVILVGIWFGCKICICLWCFSLFFLIIIEFFVILYSLVRYLFKCVLVLLLIGGVVMVILSFLLCRLIMLLWFVLG